MSYNTSISENINILKQICDCHILCEEETAKLLNTIYYLNDYIKKNELKIAFIGEFSSGKSSLLNGILGGNFLSVSDEPTTATNTYIRYGIESKASIHYPDKSIKDVSLDNLEQYLKESKKVENVDHVEIHCSANFLKKGLTLIDTPGSNADIEEHNNIRQSAIDESNATVVVISAQSGMKKSFIDFLNENKSKFYKFIFVINKCDTFDIIDDIDDYVGDINSQLELTRNEVRNKLKNEVGVKVNNIHCISAQLFLNKKESNVIDVEKSFTNLIKDIEKIAFEDKEKLIQIKLVAMLESTQLQIRELLKKENIDTNSFINDLNEISDLIDNYDNKIMPVIKKNTLEEINWLKDRVNESLSDAKLHLKREINVYIESVTEPSMFIKEVPNTISKYISSYTDNISEDFQTKVSEIFDSKIKYVNDSFLEFKASLLAYYKQLNIPTKIRNITYLKSFCIAFVLSLLLSLLLNKNPIKNYLTLSQNKFLIIIFFIIAFFVSFVILKSKYQKAFSFNFESHICKIDKIKQNFKSKIVIDSIKQNQNVRLWIGIILATLSSFILPVIGTIVGFLLGYWIGSFFGPSLSDLKTTYHKEAENVLNQNLDTYHRKLLITADIYLIKIENTSLSTLNKLRKKYNYVLKRTKKYNTTTTILLSEKSKELLNFDSLIKRHTPKLETIHSNLKQELIEIN